MTNLMGSRHVTRRPPLLNALEQPCVVLLDVPADASPRLAFAADAEESVSPRDLIDAVERSSFVPLGQHPTRS